VTHAYAYDAVLLAGFGGPEGPDDVMPFLRNVTRGRGVPDERLADVAEHYLALGGVSPINEHNRQLRSALQAELDARGVAVPVLWGNRNWAPYLADTVAEAHRGGLRRLLGLATSAYSSYSSCRQYRENFATALIDTDLVGGAGIDKIRPYYDLPGFLEPFADGLAAALDEADRDGHGDVAVLFTTHSIPLTMADASGTASDGRLYVEQHLAGCREVARLAGERRAASSDAPTGQPSWQLVYQSRSGAPHIPWLEPDIGDVIAQLAGDGTRAVIVVPIGFISDHVEVIWDLDTEAAEVAAEHGVWFRRVATPGVDPRFVSGLADLIVARLTGGPDVASATSLPSRPGTCPPGCCRANPVRPTTAGEDSAADWAGLDFSTDALTASGIDGVLTA
jgi:ferrochelatase